MIKSQTSQVFSSRDMSLLPHPNATVEVVSVGT